MNKKGFTLIELLAVIVILAVIALIATPMILGVIETARKGAAESSASGYLDAVEKQIMLNQLDSNATKITDGVYDLPMNGISVKGEQPSEGWIVIKNSKIEDYSMKIMDYIATKGNEATKEGTVAEKPSTEVSYTCRRATVLHTEVCQGGQSCSSKYAADETITYGRLGTMGEELQSGDALDCDVDGTGYNHRFYYVTNLESNPDYAELVYYNNTTSGVADNTESSLIAYDSSDKNYQGPVTAITNLPTKEQWKNVDLSSKTRAITNQKGIPSTFEGPLPTAFSYSGYASRLLTYQEVDKACDEDTSTTGVYLDTCNYLMENTKYSASSMGTYGYWLETPTSDYIHDVWSVYSSNRNLYIHFANSDYYSGVRPAIEVLKSEISY